MEQVAASVSLIRPRSRVRVLVRDNAPATEAGRPELPRLGDWPAHSLGSTAFISLDLSFSPV